MESLAKMMVASLELVEAEGRVLKQSLIRMGIAVALGLLVTVLLMAGVGFLVYGLFLYLKDPLTPAGAATIMGVVALAMAIGGGLIVRALLLPAKPKIKREKEKDPEKAAARVHQEAVARIRTLSEADLDREVPFFVGRMAIRDILWNMIISHGVHHRGQLVLMCRLAGGQAPGLYGPNREETAAMRAAASA